MKVKVLYDTKIMEIGVHMAEIALPALLGYEEHMYGLQECVVRITHLYSHLVAPYSSFRTHPVAHYLVKNWLRYGPYGVFSCSTPRTLIVATSLNINLVLIDNKMR